jgi:tryptophanyl-tRNA synthetase
MENKKETIVTGIQPTGPLHIGHFLGLLRNYVEELQDEYKGRCFLFTADYHSMNEPDIFADYQTNGIELATELLALGFDPKKVTLFHQKDVPEVAELCWMFNTVVPVAFLERMTQFKDKSERAKSVNAGLLIYPVLQAADILIYGGDRVPVGEDQVQHVELTRDVARFWNNRFGETFIEPKPLLTKSARVMALNFPERKMSKSIPGSAIFLADSPDEIRAKVRRAVTATTAPEGQMPAGVRNLFELFTEFGPADELKKFERQYADGGIRYSELKDAVADHIIAYFADFRAKRAEFLKHPNEVKKIFARGGKLARERAQETMKMVREKIGF